MYWSRVVSGWGLFLVGSFYFSFYYVIRHVKCPLREQKWDQKAQRETCGPTNELAPRKVAQQHDPANKSQEAEFSREDLVNSIDEVIDLPLGLVDQWDG